MKRWIFIIVLCLCSLVTAAKNEWILGGPQDTYEVEEWVLGQPGVSIDGAAAPPADEYTHTFIIMTTLPAIFILGLVGIFCSGRKAA